MPSNQTPYNTDPAAGRGATIAAVTNEQTADIDPEDAKLITLARGSRARIGALEGAAVRDQDGRTYSAATIAVGDLRLSALEVAVAMAASSGVQGLEAAVVVTAADVLADPEVQVVRVLGGDSVHVLRAGLDGSVREVLT
jgi:predicted RNA-binding Zn ribbon-like protein